MTSTAEQQHELRQAYKQGRLEGENAIMKNIIEEHLKIKLTPERMTAYGAEANL